MPLTRTVLFKAPDDPIIARTTTHYYCHWHHNHLLLESIPPWWCILLMLARWLPLLPSSTAMPRMPEQIKPTQASHHWQISASLVETCNTILATEALMSAKMTDFMHSLAVGLHCTASLADDESALFHLKEAQIPHLLWTLFVMHVYLSGKVACATAGGSNDAIDPKTLCKYVWRNFCLYTINCFFSC